MTAHNTKSQRWGNRSRKIGEGRSGRLTAVIDVERLYCVYMHVKEDGGCFYVGSGTRARAYTHSNRNVLWHECVREPGKNTVLIVSSHQSREEAYARELELIRERRPRCNMQHNPGAARCGQAGRARAVVRMDTGECFSSVREAARATGISDKSVNGVCTGRYRHVRGMVFKYLDRED